MIIENEIVYFQRLSDERLAVKARIKLAQPTRVTVSPTVEIERGSILHRQKEKIPFLELAP